MSSFATQATFPVIVALPFARVLQLSFHLFSLWLSSLNQSQLQCGLLLLFPLGLSLHNPLLCMCCVLADNVQSFFMPPNAAALHSQTQLWAQSIQERVGHMYIYIYAFSRRFYPKRLSVHLGYTFFLSLCVFPGN